MKTRMRNFTRIDKKANRRELADIMHGCYQGGYDLNQVI
jgi:hypothetical protein